MVKYEAGLFYPEYRSRQQDYLAEAQNDSLVRQAQQSQPRNVSKMLKVKRVVGRSLVKLGERVASDKVAWQHE